MPWLAAIPAIAQIGSSLIGNEASRKEGERADKVANATRDMLAGIALPDIEKQKLLLQLPQLQGTYNPELESSMALGPSAMEGISLTPELAQAQMASLQGLQDISQNGLTEADLAALRGTRRQVAGQEQSRQADILEDLAKRGVSGGGMELAMRMKSSQEAADRASQESDRTVQMAQQAKLAALTQAGALGGQIRGQEFGEQSDVAKAKDIINQFNTANQQSVQQRNVGNKNIAAQQNLSNQQRISEMQADTMNKQQQYNKALEQTNFENNLKKVTGQVGANQNLQNMYQQQGSDAGKMWAGLGTGLASTAANALQQTDAQKQAAALKKMEDEI